MRLAAGLACAALAGVAWIISVQLLTEPLERELESLRRANRQLATELRLMTDERDDWRWMARQ